MGKSVNKVTLLGTLGKDPELKYTPQGTAVATVSMATNSGYKDKKSDEWMETTEWHSLKAWGRLAEVMAEYCFKGDRFFCIGRLQTQSWDDKKTGEKKYRTEIIIEEMTLLGNKKGGGDRGENRSDDRAGFDQRPQSQSTQITDEDIPF